MQYNVISVIGPQGVPKKGIINILEIGKALSQNLLCSHSLYMNRKFIFSQSLGKVLQNSLKVENGSALIDCWMSNCFIIIKFKIYTSL